MNHPKKKRESALREGAEIPGFRIGPEHDANADATTPRQLAVQGYPPHGLAPWCRVHGPGPAMWLNLRPGVSTSFKFPAFLCDVAQFKAWSFAIIK